MERLVRRGVERRGDQYVVRYEDDTGSHERAFTSRREAKAFRAALGPEYQHGVIRGVGDGPIDAQTRVRGDDPW